MIHRLLRSCSSVLLLLAMGLVLSSCVPVLAAGSVGIGQSVGVPAQTGVALDLMEQQWLGAAFRDQPVEVRVARLEAVLYGQAHPQMPMAQRLKTLATTFAQTHPETGGVPVVSQSTPVSSPAASNAPGRPPSAAYSNARTPYPAPGNAYTNPSASTSPSMTTTLPGTSSQYPVVDQMEQRALSQTYPNEPLETRLSRLEKGAFGQDRPSASLYDRTEALKDRILPNQASDTADGSDDQVSTSTQGTLQTSQPVTQRIGTLEQRLLKQTYPAEAEGARLNRLELKIFNQTAPADVSVLARVERLETVASAPRSGGIVGATGWNHTVQMALPFAIMVLLMLL